MQSLISSISIRTSRCRARTSRCRARASHASLTAQMTGGVPGSPCSPCWGSPSSRCPWLSRSRSQASLAAQREDRFLAPTRLLAGASRAPLLAGASRAPLLAGASRAPLLAGASRAPLPTQAPLPTRIRPSGLGAPPGRVFEAARPARTARTPPRGRPLGPLCNSKPLLSGNPSSLSGNPSSLSGNPSRLRPRPRPPQLKLPSRSSAHVPAGPSRSLALNGERHRLALAGESPKRRAARSEVTISSHPLWRLRLAQRLPRWLLYATALAGLLASARFAIAPPSPADRVVRRGPAAEPAGAELRVAVRAGVPHLGSGRPRSAAGRARAVHRLEPRSRSGHAAAFPSL